MSGAADGRDIPRVAFEASLRKIREGYAPLDRADVVAVLAEFARENLALREHSIKSATPWASYGLTREAETLSVIAERLGLRAEFDAAVRRE